VGSPGKTRRQQRQYQAEEGQALHRSVGHNRRQGSNAINGVVLSARAGSGIGITGGFNLRHAQCGRSADGPGGARLVLSKRSFGKAPSIQSFADHGDFPDRSRKVFRPRA
jgi:hypothetical protein